MNTFFEKPFVVPALIVGIALIIMSLVGASAFLKARSFENTLSVTGSTKTQVTADSAKWGFSISTRLPQAKIAEGYVEIARQLSVAKDFLSKEGIAADAIAVQPIYVEEQYYDQNFTGVREVILRQFVEVTSSDVNKIASLAQSVDRLAAAGIYIAPQSPQYFYSKLSDLRISMLSAAITDAKARAHEIASSSGDKVGKLKAAASGVVQVLAPNSIDVSDYGSYDTSSIEKEISVSVRATFFIE